MRNSVNARQATITGITNLIVISVGTIVEDNVLEKVSCMYRTVKYVSIVLRAIIAGTKINAVIEPIVINTFRDLLGFTVQFIARIAVAKTVTEAQVPEATKLNMIDSVRLPWFVETGGEHVTTSGRLHNTKAASIMSTTPRLIEQTDSKANTIPRLRTRFHPGGFIAFCVLFIF
jgi:hypothetical protein